MRRAIDVVKAYFLAQIATPSVASVRAMRALASTSCAACTKDIATIAERENKGQHTEREVGDPAWGSLVYSFRQSVGLNLITVRQKYVQPPLKLMNRDGSVVGGPDIAKIYTFLYVVESESGRIRSRTASS